MIICNYIDELIITYSADSPLYTVSQKTSKIVFVITLSHFYQVWLKDGKQSKIVWDALIFHLT